MKALLKTGLVVALLGVVACTSGGDDDDTLPGTPDAGVNLIDAGGSPDAFVCPVTATVTETPIEGEAGNTAVIRSPQADGSGDRLTWNFIVGGGTDFLQFTIEEPVTLNTALPLAMACTQGITYCWILLGEFTTEGGLDGDIFFPDTGTITITETGPTGTGRFKATITTALFNHYVNQMRVDDGCTTNTPAYEIDLAIEAPAPKPGAKFAPTFQPAIDVLR